MKRKIVGLVVSLHCAVLFILCLHHRFSSTSKRAASIVVRTLQPVPIQESHSVMTEKKSSVTRAKSVQQNKSSTKKNSVKTIDKIKSSKVPSSNSSPKKETSFDVQIPQFIQEHREGKMLPTLETKNSSYGEVLISFLQQELQLPEWGDVRVRFQVSAQGRIHSVEILDAKSTRNAEWLKEQLTLLFLPEFRDFGILEAALEFTIVFRNEERF